MKFWHIDSPRINDPRRVAMFLGEAGDNPRSSLFVPGVTYQGFWMRIMVPGPSWGEYVLRSQQLVIATAQLDRDSSRSCARGAP